MRSMNRCTSTVLVPARIASVNLGFSDSTSGRAGSSECSVMGGGPWMRPDSSMRPLCKTRGLRVSAQRLRFGLRL